MQPVVFLLFYLDEAKAAAAKLTTSPKLGCYSTHKECYWHWTKIEISYTCSVSKMWHFLAFPTHFLHACRKFKFLFSVNSKCNSIIKLFLKKLFIVVLVLLESFWYWKWNLIHIVACYSSTPQSLLNTLSKCCATHCVNVVEHAKQRVLTDTHLAC